MYRIQTWTISKNLREQDFSFTIFSQKWSQYPNFKIGIKQGKLTTISIYTIFSYLHNVYLYLYEVRHKTQRYNQSHQESIMVLFDLNWGESCSSAFEANSSTWVTLPRLIDYTQAGWPYPGWLNIRIHILIKHTRPIWRHSRQKRVYIKVNILPKAKQIA